MAEERKNYFCQEEAIPLINRAKTTDYTHSGYDRGHLRAAANASTASKAETFVMSNVFPQNHSLNLTYWKRLENLIRQWTQFYDLIEIFTGIICPPMQFPDGRRLVVQEVIGKGDVAVPSYCYKVLFLHKWSRVYPTAYIFPNQAIEEGRPLEHFMVRVEEIQRLSGVLFFPMYG